MRCRKSDGFTLIELLLVVAIIAIVAAIATPALLRARITGNEASAVGSLRAIGSAEAAYASACAFNGYATDLSDLVKPPPGSTQGYLSPDLNSNGVLKSGFIVNLAADNGAVLVMAPGTACNNNVQPATSGYFAETHPASIGWSGQRSFGTDTRSTIYFDSTGAPFVAPIPAGATVLQ
jgi:type IV pilus assembly protein PilA